MITAVNADLQRIFQLAFVKRLFAFEAFDKNAFGFDALFAVVQLLIEFWLVAPKPIHKII
jgi:hypothetical protein